MKAFFALLCLVSLPHSAAAGTLELYRWNPGTRADSEAAWSSEMTESQVRELLREPAKFAADHPDALYGGCYLARHRALAPDGRSPAGEKPSVSYKICF